MGMDDEGESESEDKIARNESDLKSIELVLATKA